MANVLSTPPVRQSIGVDGPHARIKIADAIGNLNVAVNAINGVQDSVQADQPANEVFAGPASGSPQKATFRSLVAQDFPGVSGTILLAKLTGGGTNGSITVSHGIITAFTNPT